MQVRIVPTELYQAAINHAYTKPQCAGLTTGDIIVKALRGGFEPPYAMSPP